MDMLLKLESSANSSLGSSSQPHPLLIPVILSDLLKYVPVGDLRSCRLVCKAWESSSRPRWRSKVRLVIDGERLGRRSNRAVGHGREDDDDQRTPFMEFLQLLQNTHDQSEVDDDEHNKLTSIPFSNICVRDGNTLHIPFFQQYGTHIKNLQLITTGTGEDWNGIDLKRILLQLTPNLQVLTVKGGWSESLGAHKDFIASGASDTLLFPEHEHLQVFHVDMGESRKEEYSLDFGFWLRHFPNIQTLKVRGLDQGDIGTRIFWQLGRWWFGLDVAQAFPRLEALMKGIAELREEFPNKLKISHLDILDALIAPLERIEPLVDLLRRATLSLTTLKIDFGYYTEESAVQELLQRHSCTLQTLHCFKAESPPNSTIYNNFLGQNTTYPNLRELVLGGCFVGLNFNFLRSTPNLEILRHSEEMKKTYRLLRRRSNMNGVTNFKFETTDSDMDMDNMDFRLERLKELSGRFTIDNPACFRKVAKCMPNLEILDVPLSKDTFPVVCESWGGTLRELTIRQTSSQVDDEVLTGIPRGWPTRHSRFSLKDQPANLAHLKVLEHFNDFNPDSRSVSNHSVCWGFLHLPRLTNVFVNVPQGNVNISGGNRSNLRKKKVTLKFRQVTDENYV